MREHYDKVVEIDRLRVHVKDNILYYMQAIWSHEPPDQRFFRLYNIDVPVITAKSSTVNVEIARGSSAIDALLERDTGVATIRMPTVEVVQKKLVEVADLDTVLGYSGNYTIFALKENNLLTLYMMQDYLDVGEELLGARSRRARRLHGRGAGAAGVVSARAPTRISTTSTERT